MKPMIRTLLLVVGVLASQLSLGQTLHLLVFADTDDPEIGGSNMKIFSALTGPNGMASTIAKQAGLTLYPTNFYGANCRVDQLVRTLDALKTGPDDVVLFYFVGHGFNNRQNEYPSLIFGNANAEPATIDASSRNLREIYARIRAKKPRLTIVIGDACNKERTDPPAPVTSARAIGVMPPQVLSSARFKSLFRTWQGGILMSSSQRNQYAHSDPKGGWMSVSLLNALNDWCAVSHRDVVNWKGLLDETTARTVAIARQNSQDQVPQYLIELTPYAGTTPVVPPVNNLMAGAICPTPDQFVNEIALSGVRDDMPLLQDMRHSITSANATAYAEAFTEFYQNQKPFYQSLATVLFNPVDDLPDACRKQFRQDTEWLKPSIQEINDRYDIIFKYADKPAQLVMHARTQLPSILVRLQAILEKLDK